MNRKQHNIQNDGFIVCPYCNHKHHEHDNYRNYHEELTTEGSHEYECDNCEKLFLLHTNAVYYYETEGIED